MLQGARRFWGLGPRMPSRTPLATWSPAGRSFASVEDASENELRERLVALRQGIEKLRAEKKAMRARKAHGMLGGTRKVTDAEPILLDMDVRLHAIREEEEARAREQRAKTRAKHAKDRLEGSRLAREQRIMQAMEAEDWDALASLEEEEEPVEEEMFDPQDILPRVSVGSNASESPEDQLLLSMHSNSAQSASKLKQAKAMGKQRFKAVKPFKDRARVSVRSGAGGNGAITFATSAKKRRGPPSGGSGGDGGDVIFRVVERKSLFGITKPQYRAGNGMNGAKDSRHGRRGENAVINVPPGTLVKQVFLPARDEFGDLLPEAEEGEEGDAGIPAWLTGAPDVVGEEDEVDDEEEGHDDGDEEFAPTGIIDVGDEEDEEGLTRGSGPEGAASRGFKALKGKQRKVKLIASLDTAGEELVVAKGGQGGKGNLAYHYTRSRDKEQFRETHAKGADGEELTLELELKLMADVGLVGYPNAGKSSLLRVVSNATPKVASYAFTTIHPTVGMVEYNDYAQISIADLPGLIRGAHLNRGLGHQFLRHVERTKVLCFVLDMGTVDGRDPVRDLESLMDELEQYEPGLLASKRAVVAANKMDLPVAPDNLRKLEAFVADGAGGLDGELALYPISTRRGTDLPDLLRELRQLVEQCE